VSKYQIKVTSNETLLLVAAGYLLGSMPWATGSLAGRARRHPRHGSATSGTNVWRVYGGAGLAVVLLDAEGLRRRSSRRSRSRISPGARGGGGDAGHWVPLFLRWQRGGKVVATCGGRVSRRCTGCRWHRRRCLDRRLPRLPLASLASIVGALFAGGGGPIGQPGRCSPSRRSGEGSSCCIARTSTPARRDRKPFRSGAGER